ncbi:MAG: zinc-binding dehydrogenase [Solirubrobacteraceae bacterium]
MIRAAVAGAIGRELEVLDLDLEEPRAGELRLRIAASGICGSDLSVLSGSLPSPMPIVLGHEAAGVVVEVGAGVSGASRGDRVIVCAMPQCGDCYRCARGRPELCERGEGVLRSGGLLDGTARFRTRSGEVVHQMVAAGTFAEEVVVSEASVVRIPDDVPLVRASLLGCAVITGAGAALNKAAIKPDDTVVVLGSGTVGLSAVQGARLAGAERIVAIDLIAAKLALARRCGATETIDASEQDAVGAVAELTGGRGADVTIEAVGSQRTVDDAIAMTGRGGEVVFVGAGGKDVRVNVRQFAGLVGAAKTFKGCLYGAADIRRDIPRLVEHYRAGELELEALVSRTFTIDQINEGFAAVAAGEVTAAVVEFDGHGEVFKRPEG